MGDQRLIYKFPIDGETTLWVQTRERPLHVAEQQGRVMAWFLVNPDMPVLERRFCLIGTGMIFDRTCMSHVGTVPMDSGFVWHVFERTNIG